MGRKLNLNKMRFGRLIVVKRYKSTKHKIPRTRWLCLCLCGKMKAIGTRELRRGDTTSCGCRLQEIKIDLPKASITHGMSKINCSEYNIWKLMRKRCTNPQTKDAKYYINVKVCKKWSKFENFYKDMGPRPSKRHSIDRINNNGDYKPSNCRWATPIEQSNNRSNVINKRNRDENNKRKNK